MHDHCVVFKTAVLLGWKSNLLPPGTIPTEKYNFDCKIQTIQRYIPNLTTRIVYSSLLYCTHSRCQTHYSSHVSCIEMTRESLQESHYCMYKLQQQQQQQQQHQQQATTTVLNILNA